MFTFWCVLLLGRLTYDDEGRVCDKKHLQALNNNIEMTSQSKQQPTCSKHLPTNDHSPTSPETVADNRKLYDNCINQVHSSTGSLKRGARATSESAQNEHLSHDPDYINMNDETTPLTTRIRPKSSVLRNIASSRRHTTEIASTSHSERRNKRKCIDFDFVSDNVFHELRGQDRALSNNNNTLNNTFSGTLSRKIGFSRSPLSSCEFGDTRAHPHLLLRRSSSIKFNGNLLATTV